jgi:hypothetical protein
MASSEHTGDNESGYLFMNVEASWKCDRCKWTRNETGLLTMTCKEMVGQERPEGIGGTESRILTTDEVVVE